MRYVLWPVVVVLISSFGCVNSEEPGNLLANPGFEEKAEAWVKFGQPRYQAIEGAGRNGSECLRYQKETEAEGEKENSHYDQEVEVEPNSVYVTGAWFRTEGDLRPVIRIASTEWQTLDTAVSGPSKEWQEVRLMFSARDQKRVRFQIFGGALGEKRESSVGTSYCDDVFLRKATEAELAEFRRCRVEVGARDVLREINPLFFGVNSLFMVEDDASRADGKIEKYLREMPCRLIRFPGGEMADNYHWKTHRLDNPMKWPKVEGPQTMDTDEFMDWCRRIGAEPIFVANLESGFVHAEPDAGVREAAEWVQYCNKEKGYQIKYWEIGNETYLNGTLFPLTARQYADALAKFSRAMKAVDPTIKIGAVGPKGAEWPAPIDKEAGGPAWWPTILEIAGNPADGGMDFAIIHEYYHLGQPDYESYSWQRLKAGDSVAQLRAFFRERVPDRNIPIALTEWNTGKGAQMKGIGHALVIAELIGNYIEGGVDMATYWPLRLPGKASGFRVMMDYDTNEPRPAYYVMKLFSSNIGSQLVKCASSNVQVYACAGRDEKETKLSVFLVNKSLYKDGVEAEVAVNGFEASTIKAVSLVAPDQDSDDVSLKDLTITGAEDKWICCLPPHSLTVVMFAK